MDIWRSVLNFSRKKTVSCIIFSFLFIYLFIFILTLFYFTIPCWFCHTLTWIHHGCTCDPKHEPPSHLPPRNIPPGPPRAPAPGMLYPALDIDWWFDSYMIVYMFQVYVQCRIQHAWGWCMGMTQRDAMGREVEGGFMFGNACTSMVDSCQCMAKPIQYCKVK